MALIVGADSDASAQVVERQQPYMSTTEVLARSTILGAGTGLILGGTYTLVADEVDTGEVLRWSLASGAAGGLILGLIETLRGDDSTDEIGAVQFDDDGLRFSPLGLLPEKRRDLADVRHGAYDVGLVRLGT
jgi:hypothetical protein